MNVLITGGAGFIGSHLAENLLQDGHSVFVIDNFATGRRDTLSSQKSLQIQEASIVDAEVTGEIFDRFRPELVIHCAASYKDPDNWAEDVRTNVLGTVNIVKGALSTKVRRFIYFQTALCYGNYPREQPITLDHPLSPESSYAISKTAAENYIALSGLEFLSFRLANICGPRNLSGPIPTFYSRLAAGKNCFAVDSRRDYVFIDDQVEALMKAVQGRGNSGYYHISTGSDYSIREIYEAVAEALGSNQPVEERPRGADDTPTILLDPSKTRNDFGWRASTPLKEAIRKAVEWYKVYGVENTYTHLKMKD